MKRTPISKYAVKETRVRLKHYAKALRHAAKHPDDQEAIHDLRVSIRRVTQSLRTFRGLLDPAPLKRFRGRLRKLMDLCAAVRNCDVALDLLPQVGITGNATMKKTRVEAEKSLHRRLKKERKKPSLSVDTASPPADGDWKLEQSPEDNLRRVLPAQAEEYFAAGWAAISQAASYQTLHQFRLRSKRFRYTLELFEHFYGSEMGRGAKILKELQDRLGAINDCATTIDLLKSDRRVATALSELLRRRRTALQTYARGQFTPQKLDWWKGWLSRPLTRPKSSVASSGSAAHRG